MNERSRKEKTMPFGVNSMRSQVLYRATQGDKRSMTSVGMPAVCMQYDVYQAHCYASPAKLHRLHRYLDIFCCMAGCQGNHSA